MTAQVKLTGYESDEPFAMLFGKEVDKPAIEFAEGELCYDPELQLQTHTETGEAIYKVTEQSDGTLKIHGPVNGITTSVTTKITWGRIVITDRLRD